jgi:hypothetical protein
VEDFLDGGPDLGALGGRQFHCSVDAVEDPSQNFLSERPDAVTLLQFLERDGLVVGVSDRVGSWWEDGVDAVEQSPGVVEKYGRVGALKARAEVINKAFKKGLELLGLGREVLIGP